MGSSGLGGRLPKAWLATVVASGFVGAVVATAVLLSRWSGVVAAGALTIAFVTSLVAYLILWREAMVRAHLYLLPRDQWGDATRVALFFLSFAAFPVVTLLLPVLMAVLISV